MIVSFDVEIYERTAIYTIEQGKEKEVYELLCLAYDEWLENVNEICGGCCCEEWLQMQVVSAGYQCEYVESKNWEV